MVVLGLFDMNIEQRRMNALKPVTVSIARVLLKHGQAAIDAARAFADLRGLPGKTARDKVWWNLKWFTDDLAKRSNANEVYASGDSLKGVVIQAFIEWNAVEEGVATLDAAWAEMWDEIATELAKLPQKVLDAAGKAVEDVAWYAKVSFWAVVAATGLVGYGAYRVISGPVGQSAARRYLGSRR